MEPFSLEKRLLGRTITIQVTPLDSGLHLLLVGGDRSHVGAVSMAESGELLHSWAFPTHREQVVSDKWAARISSERRCAATVACGIHYDNATKEEIQTILQLTDALLQEVLEILERTGEQQ